MSSSEKFAAGTLYRNQRNTMYDELHARPAVEIAPPSLLTHLAYTTGYGRTKDGNILLRKRNGTIDLIRLCYQDFGYRLPFKIARLSDVSTDDEQFLHQTEIFSNFRHQVTLVKENKRCVIQTHTEFLSITFLLQRESFTDYDWSAIPETIREWRSEAFQPDIATHIRIEQRNSEQDLTYNLAQTFNGQFQKEFMIHDIYRDLLASQVSDGAFVWTPFRPFEDDFNRILVRNVGLSSARLGRLAQRLLEIDTYVFMALLGLDSARSQLRKLRQHQNDLSLMLSKTSDSKRDKQQIYEKLSVLSRSTAKDVASTRYRFYASRAYADLVWERVEQLREQKVAGWSRIGYFLERSFRPAVQTCESALNFQNGILQSIEQAVELLGAGVSIDLELEGKNIERRMLYLTIAILVLTVMAALYYTSHVLHDWNLIVLPGSGGGH
jgi:Protein of unknown function (DUF3422)